MKVDNLRVYWRHVNNVQEDKKRYLEAKKNKTIKGTSSHSYTECVIVEEDTGNVLSSRRAFCFPLDNFDKRIGRKISFTKAVSNISDKELRKSLWEELVKISPKTLQI